MSEFTPEIQAAINTGDITQEEATRLYGSNRNSRSAPTEATPTTLRYVRACNVRPKPIRWLWPNRLALGKLNLISGDPGLGKSMLTSAFAATVSRGVRWPDGCGDAPVGNVIMLSDEDAVDDTIRPRLDAAGADCERVFCVEMVVDTNHDGSPVERGFNLQADIEPLRDMVAEIGDVALIVIDPISAYLGGTDSHKNADVRGLLSPLTELASESGAAIVMVTHLNKGGGAAIYRSIGSIAFAAAARSAWAVTKDKDEPSRRLVLPMKNNLGQDTSGLAYEILTADNGAPFVAWEPDPIDVNVDDALSANSESGLGSALDDATDWLSVELNAGPQLQSDIRRRAATEGHSWRTVRRAKDTLGVIAKKDLGPQGKWRWWHPEDARPVDMDTLDTLPETVATKGSQQDVQGVQRLETGQRTPCRKCAGEGCALCRQELAGVTYA